MHERESIGALRRLSEDPKVNAAVRALTQSDGSFAAVIAAE